MNARMLPVFIRLLGKLVAKYDVLSDLDNYDESERDILRLAKTEYEFYRPERVEAPANIDSIEKSAARKTLGLAGRGAKATS